MSLGGRFVQLRWGDGAESCDSVTIAGRLIAAVLMFVGAAFSATIIGFIAMFPTSNGTNNNPNGSLPGISSE
jgi:hypothetical protein